VLGQGVFDSFIDFGDRRKKFLKLLCVLDALLKLLESYYGILTLSAPNDVDLRFAVFLLWAKRRISTSKYLNFPPYDVIGIKLKSMISATNLVFIESGEPRLSIYSMKKSFTLQPRDLCRLKKLVWGAKFALLWEEMFVIFSYL
jgi:hypothetical protein